MNRNTYQSDKNSFFKGLFGVLGSAVVVLLTAILHQLKVTNDHMIQSKVETSYMKEDIKELQIAVFLKPKETEVPKP